MAKAKRKTGKQRKRDEAVEEDSAAVDPMTQCVELCQAERWREAVLLFMQMCNRAKEEENSVMADNLATAQHKVEYSLRRQMAAGLIDGVRKLLAEEYLLDVGPE